MSVKNRVFALAIGTAALVAASAPMASAASFAGPHSGTDGSHSHYTSNSTGFNNDSTLNVSGNQLNSQTCTYGAQAATGTVIQPVISAAGLGDLPIVSSTSDAASTPGLNTGELNPSNTGGCTQDPAPAPASNPAPTSGTNGHDSGGFNNDSTASLGNNQLQNQICSVAAQTGTATVLQLVLGIAAPLSPTMTTGMVAPANSAPCTQGTTSTTPNS